MQCPFLIMEVCEYYPAGRPYFSSPCTHLPLFCLSPCMLFHCQAHSMLFWASCMRRRKDISLVWKTWDKFVFKDSRHFGLFASYYLFSAKVFKIKPIGHPLEGSWANIVLGPNIYPDCIRLYKPRCVHEFK